MTDKLKILAVDDKPENLFALRTVLADLHVEIVEATSGNVALAATILNDFALAILDVHMPGMDGYELADLLRGDPKTARLPIVFVTADQGEQEHVFKGYEAGAVDYIVKPYNPLVLRSKVAVFLELHRRSAELAEKVMALAASEERFRSLVMTVPDIVYRIDADGRFTFLNSAVGMLGYEPVDLIGHHFSEIVHPTEVDAISRAGALPKLKGTVASPEGAPRLFDERRTGARRTTELEVRLITREGARIPGLLHVPDERTIIAEVASSGLYAFVSGSEQPVFLGTVGVIRDITERKNSEKELDQHRAHLQELVDVHVRQQRGLSRFAQYAAVSHWTLRELLKEAVDTVTTGMEPGAEAGVRVVFGESACTTDGFHETQRRLASPILVVGEERGAVEVHYPDPHPEVPGRASGQASQECIESVAHALGEAIERRTGEEALRLSEERHRLLFETSRDAIMTLAPPSWTFTSGNPAAIEMFGARDRDDFVSRPPWAYSPPEQPDRRPSVGLAIEMLEAAMRNGSHAFAWRHRRLNGEEFPAAVQLSRFEASGQPQLQATVRDLTEAKRAQEERARIQARLTESQRLESIGTLASGVAHEINNPLAVVMNYAQLILDEESIQGSPREHAETIISESERMATIVRNLLTFSRQRKEEHSPAHVATLVDGTVSLMRSLLRKDQIEVVVDVPDDLPSVHCRSQQIQQVLMNLLTNARDALNARFVGASPDKILRISAAPFERDGVPWVRVTVEDRGGGIPADVAGRLFDPFFTTKPKDKGTGLGLSISHGIVREHGGELWFESEPGIGTRFHVDLKVDNGWKLSPEPDEGAAKGG